MSFATARRDIEKRLSDNWATTKIGHDNVDFTPPNDDYWVKLRIFEDTANRMNIGTPGVHRVSGTIVVEINGPLNQGTQIIRGYADTIAAIFRDAQFNGITCREAVPANVGEVNGWYRYNVSIAFYYDGRYS